MTTSKRVVRFYGNADFALETVALNEITFISPEKFNDPFDPNYKLINEFKSDDDLTEWVKDNRSEYYNHFKKIFPSNKDLATANGNVTKKLKNRFKNIYIFSTSGFTTKYPNSTYMWGHYGNGYKGIAIEFNAEKLKGTPTDNEESIIPMEMNYGPKPPKITHEEYFEYIMHRTGHSKFSTEKIMKKMNEIFSWKNENWRPENEYRFLLDTKKTQLHFVRKKLIPKTITAIYLGLKVDHDLKKRVRAEAKDKQPHANVYEAVKNGYNLNFKEVTLKN